MSIKSLLEPIVENGIKNTNFFEGRLLTGRDLREQETADREHRRQLGRAIGAGIVEGLEVEIDKDGSDGTPPVVKVLKGMAINAKGQALEVPDDYLMVRLSRTLEVAEAEGDIFFNCAGPPTTKGIRNGAGIYILVMAPTAGYEDYAPKSGLQHDGKVRECGRRYIVEGIHFHLVELDPASLSGISEGIASLLQNLLTGANPAKVAEPDRLSKLRNIIAHLCFGTETLKRFAADPFARKNNESAYISYSAIDDLHRLKLLTDCDVPLALLYWTLDGIAFLDMWSVRRRPYELMPSAKWPTIASPRRLAEAEAMFFQFQEHIHQLVQDHTDPRLIKAEEYFCYLPPAGFICLRRSTSEGLVPDTFFDLLPHRSAPEFNGAYDEFIDKSPQFIDSSLVEVIVANSFRYQPIILPQKENELSPEEQPNQEMVWLYYPWQQIHSIKKGEEIEHYLLFAVAHLPSFGNARFDVARWDFSNYARCCK